MPKMPESVHLNLNLHLDGVTLIAAERHRVKRSSSYGDQHDDEHDAAELAMAAVAYIHHAVGQINGVEWEEDDDEYWPSGFWPWVVSDWRPSDDPIRNLVIAGQFIAAEIDRLQRKEARS